MRLVLVRHGESTWNATGRWQGQSDVPLSPRGRLQARALAARLFELVVERRICSDLSRAAETAAALGAEVEPDPRFREIDVGEWAGLERREVAERFPEQVEALRSGAPLKIGGGESMPEFEARVDAAVDELRARHAGQRVLLVTHGGVIRALATRVLDLRRTGSPLVGVSNTSVSVVRDEDGRLALEVYNDVTHLDPGDKDSSVMQLPAASTRLAIIAVDPERPAERRTADALLGGLGIARIYADPELSEGTLAEQLVAERAQDLSIEAVRALAAEHEDGSFAVLLGPARARALTAGLVGLSDRGALGLATPEHASVAQVRVTERGAVLTCYGVRLGGEPSAP